jgi:hypothetical protein
VQRKLSMNWLKAVAVMLVLAVSPFTAAAAPPSDPIAIQVDGNVVTATGLTPGGKCAVVVSWYTRRSGIGVTLETVREAEVDAAGAASVQFELNRPASGLIAVIDVPTGRLAIDPGDGSAFELVDLPPARLKRNEQREIETLTSPQMSAMIVLARPGDGVWVQRVSDGGRDDADGALDGRIVTDPQAMKSMAGSGPPPKKIKPRDTILIVDRQAGTYAVTEVTP